MLLESLRVVPPRVGDRAAGSYVWDLPVTKHLLRETLYLHSPVTIIAGDNGAGKSTLIEAIATRVGFGGAGGRIHDHNAQGTGTESPLGFHLFPRLTDNIHRGYFLRAETHMALLAAGEHPDERAGRNVLDRSTDLFARSHGESIFDVLDEHVQGPGLYIFDEPEAGLTVVRQMALLAEITRQARRGGQFIIATHSPVLMAIPQAEILHISESGIELQSREQTEAVAAMREFLADVDGTVDYLTEGLD